MKTQESNIQTRSAASANNSSGNSGVGLSLPAVPVLQKQGEEEELPKEPPPLLQDFFGAIQNNRPPRITATGPPVQRAVQLGPTVYNGAQDQRALLGEVQRTMQQNGYTATNKLLMECAKAVRGNGLLNGRKFDDAESFIDFVSAAGLVSPKVTARAGKYRPKTLGKRPAFDKSIGEARVAAGSAAAAADYTGDFGDAETPAAATFSAATTGSAKKMKLGDSADAKSAGDTKTESKASGKGSASGGSGGATASAAGKPASGGGNRGTASRHVIPSHLLGYAAENVAATPAQMAEWLENNNTAGLTLEKGKSGRIHRRNIWKILHNHKGNLWAGNSVNNSAIGFVSGEVENLITKIMGSEDNKKKEQIGAMKGPSGGDQQLGMIMGEIMDTVKVSFMVSVDEYLDMAKGADAEQLAQARTSLNEELHEVWEQVEADVPGWDMTQYAAASKDVTAFQNPSLAFFSAFLKKNYPGTYGDQ